MINYRRINASKIESYSIRAFGSLKAAVEFQKKNKINLVIMTGILEIMNQYELSPEDIQKLL